MALENVLLLLATFLGDFSRRKSETDNGSIVDRHKTQKRTNVLPVDQKEKKDQQESTSNGVKVTNLSGP